MDEFKECTFVETGKDYKLQVDWALMLLSALRSRLSCNWCARVLLELYMLSQVHHVVASLAGPFRSELLVSLCFCLARM